MQHISRFYSLVSFQESSKDNATELAKLKRENEELRSELKTKSTKEDGRDDLERKYQDIKVSADDERK